MNEPDFEPRTAWQLYLLPGLAFILAMLLILLAALQAPALAEAQDWTPAPPSVSSAILDYQAPIIPDQEIRIGLCPTSSADADPAYMAGCTWAIPEPMPIYLLDPTDRWTLAHEYGHRFMGVAIAARDLVKLAHIVRARRPIRVYSEYAADIYASCALGLRPLAHRGNGWDRIDPHFPTPHGYSPSRSTQRRACSFIWRVGATAGLH
jgi:hypothetical protein